MWSVWSKDVGVCCLLFIGSCVSKNPVFSKISYCSCVQLTEIRNIKIVGV